MAAAAGLALTVLAGIASRRVHLGWEWWDKSLGDVLYAVAAYLLLGLCCPAWSPRKLGVAAMLYCAAVELFQLTGIPAANSRLLIVRWVLGTRFSALDLGCYLVGTLAIATLDLLWRRRQHAYT